MVPLKKFEWQYLLGLVSRVYEPNQLVDEAVKMGNKIASYSKPIGKILKMIF